ncbi:transposase [Streptomyces broussonetiae]|uniref:transposase n=1 Tax=Streptomyces broussonetiae TaxID=2686304 RepID=UPI001E5AAF09|nr:transposase [Streptomyces broussonetiae]
MKAIGWDERLSDKVNGKGMVGHAGAALLRRCADRTGLTGVLGQVLPRGSGAGWRERGQLVVMLAVAIVLGTRSLLDAEVLLAHQAALFGVPASDSTMRRALAAIDEKVLAKIAKARARVRRDVWSQVALRPGGFPWLSVVGKRLTGWIIIDIDATIIASASKKAGAAATFKRTFGFHPLAAWCANTQECLAMLLREGNAGANTVADHLRLLADVLRQIPDSSAAKILIRIDGAGATHDLLDHCPPPADSPPAPRREQEGANTHNPGAVEPGRSRSDTRRPCPQPCETKGANRQTVSRSEAQTNRGRYHRTVQEALLLCAGCGAITRTRLMRAEARAAAVSLGLEIASDATSVR